MDLDVDSGMDLGMDLDVDLGMGLGLSSDSCSYLEVQLVAGIIEAGRVFPSFPSLKESD